MAQKTREEIQELKDSWHKDPCWDIEDTEGFEEYHDELLAYSKECEAKWKAEREEKSNVPFDDYVRQIIYTLNATGDNSNEQVLATLLLATQVKRIADMLENMDDRDSLSESVSIWGSGK